MRNLKVVFLGPTEAGKTQLARRLAGKSYLEQTEPTIGSDFFSKRISEQNSLLIWDTAGLERYKFFIPRYTSGADKLCLVIPADKPLIKEEILSFLPTQNVKNDAEVYLIINKTDLGVSAMNDDDNDDDINALLEAVKEKGYSNIQRQVFRVSAKVNTGIEALRQNLSVPPKNSENIIQNDSARVFPLSYQKITNAYSSEENKVMAFEQKVMALLSDYTKGTTPVLSSLSLFAHGHFNRHHTSLVRTMIKQIEGRETSIELVLKELNDLDKNPNGSLAKRLDFLQKELDRTPPRESIDPGM